MYYGFNDDRSKIEIYSKDEMDTMLEPLFADLIPVPASWVNGNSFSSANIKYIKFGNIMFIQGTFQVLNDFRGPILKNMPTEYRPIMSDDVPVGTLRVIKNDQSYYKNGIITASNISSKNLNFILENISSSNDNYIPPSHRVFFSCSYICNAG